MSRVGYKSVIYQGDVYLGEVNTLPVKGGNFQFPNNEIRIHRILPKSERCHPLSVLQTISSSVVCKLEPPLNSATIGPAAAAQLKNLYYSCLYERKTAVICFGNEEVHLVAMPSKKEIFPCFWCYSVRRGLYEACLGMLNLRCLSIVFDLDETLIVANTMKSFQDRIDVLQGWINRETDPIWISGMSAEMKRYMEDRALLKQYMENDGVVDGGRVYTVQQEEGTPLADGHERVVRPVIRMPEKNIILTRINPEIRDTSVLVRLRPAWEDMRSYLTAKGRRRFQVYVCTMAERDYALEMWRLLDPEAHLISLNKLQERVVCVKSGARKCLRNVFQDGNCHPKMAMVIDDRLKVWEKNDQPRVHVVPAFTPYHAPQAETANAAPVLRVARNVACHVRGGFFRDFDENLCRKEAFYEDEVVNLPPAPEVSSYLISEDTSFAPTGNLHPPIAEGMNGPEVAQRLDQLDEKNVLSSTSHPMNNGTDLKAGSTQPPIASLPNVFGAVSLRAVPPSNKPSLLGAPLRRDINLSEVDPYMKRRVFMMNHGQDVNYRGLVEPPISHRSLPLQSQGGWVVDENLRDNHLSAGIIQEFDASQTNKQEMFQSGSHRTLCSMSTGLRSSIVQVRDDEVGCTSSVSRVMPISKPIFPTSHVWENPTYLQANIGIDGRKASLPPGNQLPEVGPLPNLSSSNSGKDQPEGVKATILPSLYISVLQEIGRRCHSKVEFRPVVGVSADLQFSVEVLLNGGKIGVGMGKTRKDAQQEAAENSLRSLADTYMSYVAPRSRAVDRDIEKLSLENENGFIWDTTNRGSNENPAEDGLPKGNTSEAVEVATGEPSSNVVYIREEKRANAPSPSPRIGQLQHARKEMAHDFQGLSSSRYVENGHKIA